MLNDTYIKKETFGSPVQILFAVEHQVSVSVVVDDTGVTADSRGKKILKAGTPMTGDLDDRTSPFKQSATNNVKGVLLHDVDVTRGENNGTLLIFGFVNTNRLDETTKAKITDTIKNALPKITFMAAN